MSEPVEIYSGRTIPMTGTEADRVLTIPFRKPNEIHTTTQDRMWKEDVLVSPPIDHGEVADEAAMLALNTTSATSSQGVPVGCHPGDYVDRADTGTRWTRIGDYGEYGESLDQWEETPAVDGGGTADDLEPVSEDGEIMFDSDESDEDGDILMEEAEE